MRIAQSWLDEILQKANPEFSATTDEYAQQFVEVGIEVEEVDPLPTITGPLVVGKVVEIEELTEFKKPIRFCRVDVGEAQPREIVCGARNFAVGDLVVAALPGVVLPGDFAIAARKTYGRTSDGMLCSLSELGMGRDHSGILVLEPGTAQPGDAAAAFLGLDDTVIELNITPDRGYCFSARGLTRELACGWDLEFADPAALPISPSSDQAWSVELSPESQCERFALRRVSGVDPSAASPWWLQRRLILAGVRPISPAVDVTNYVMLELGQPLHAFDASKVQGSLTVRRAQSGEKLRTLDDSVRELDAEDVVIADESGVISLAGVMGGASTEVGAETTDVLLEAATWNPLLIFRTARRHKLGSEASKRFERVVDPALPAAALERAAALLAQITGGTVVSASTEVGTPVAVRPSITIAGDLPDRVAGLDYPAGTTVRRLEQIKCTVVVASDGELTVTPPSWRPDLVQPADLVEEVLRLEGLERIPSVLPQAPVGRGLTALQRRRRAIGKALASAGLVEVLPPVFLPTNIFDVWGLAADDPRRATARVLNPLEADRPELATTLLPGLMEIMGRNLSRGQRDLALYGIAQVVRPGSDTRAVEPLPVDRRPTPEEFQTLLDSLPAQPVRVAAVLCGLIEPAGPWGKGRHVDVADAFAVVDTIASAAGVTIERSADQHLPWHPGRCAELTVDGKVVGHAGELHPAVLEKLGLPPRSCAVEIELDRLPLTENRPAPVISAFPAVLQDVSVVVDAAVPAASVAAALKAGAGHLLEDISLFDVFAGKQLGEGKKSLAFALRFRASDRTLTEDEASAARDAAVAEAAERVGAQLRS